MRLLASLGVALAAGGAARAGVPLSLPPGERATDWATAAEMAGFSLGAAPGPNGAGVALVATEAGWVIRVREPDGTERRVPVEVPHDAAEREDTLWVAASLAAPLMEAALKVPQRAPATAATPASSPAPPTAAPPQAAPPTAAPPKAAPPKAAPPKAAPPKAAPPKAAPPKATPPKAASKVPSQETATAPAVPGAPETTTSAPPETPQPVATGPVPAPPQVDPPAEAQVPRASSSVRPTVTGAGGLDATRAVTGADAPATLVGQAQLRGGVAVGPALEVAARAEIQSSSPISAFDGGERWGRAELGVDVGLLRRGAITWGPRASLSFVRYRFSTDAAGGLGGLGVPAIGLELTMARPLSEDWAALLCAGLDRDLREVRIQQEGSETSYSLPRSHLSVLIGIGWGP